jgi:hypothetical protein
VCSLGVGVCEFLNFSHETLDDMRWFPPGEVVAVQACPAAAEPTEEAVEPTEEAGEDDPDPLQRAVEQFRRNHPLVCTPRTINTSRTRSFLTCPELCANGALGHAMGAL